MDMQHRMLRTAVGAVVDKALRDIPRDGKRSVRNLADMGECLAKSDAQKQFFAQVKQAISSPSSLYFWFAQNLVKQVSPQRLRTLAVNFGCSSLTYGVGVLRSGQQALGEQLPWIVEAGDYSSGQTDPLIERANAFGCYAFMVGDESPEQAYALAKRHPESTFFLRFSPGRVNESTMPALSQLVNADVSLDAGEPGFEKAAGLLYHARIPFGFYASCNDEASFGRFTGESFLRRMTSCHCLSGIYAGPPGSGLEKNIRRFVRQARLSKKGLPFVLLDLYDDLAYIAEVISPGGGALYRQPSLPSLGYFSHLSPQSAAAK